MSESNGRPEHVRIPETQDPKKSITRCIDCDDVLDATIVLAGYGRCAPCQMEAVKARNQGN